MPRKTHPTRKASVNGAQPQRRTPDKTPARQEELSPEEENRRTDELLLQVWQRIYDRHHPVAQTK